MTILTKYFEKLFIRVKNYVYSSELTCVKDGITLIEALEEQVFVRVEVALLQVRFVCSNSSINFVFLFAC